MTELRARDLAGTMSLLLVRILRNQPDVNPALAARVASAAGATVARELLAGRPTAADDTDVIELVPLTPTPRQTPCVRSSPW